MQLAVAAASINAGSVAGPARPISKISRFLAAGVAVAGLGVVAASPVGSAVSGLQQRGVALTSVSDTTSANFEQLSELLSANPNPIAGALGELAEHYGGIASTSIEQSMAGVEGIWSGMGASKGLETIIPLIGDYLKDGNFTSAYNLINNDMLFNMLNVFQPLFDHTVRGTGEEVPGLFGIGASLTHDLGNLQELFGDFNFYKSGAKYLMEPLIGFQFALSDGLTDHGDHVAQDPIDALLNGYVPWAAPDGSEADPHAAFIGLLTENGTLAYLLNGLPTLIADALTQGLPDDAAESAAFAAGALDLPVADLPLADLLG